MNLLSRFGIGHHAAVTNDRYAQLLDALGLSHSKAARELGITERTSRRYVAGTKEIPDDIADQLEQIADARVAQIKGRDQ